MESDLADQLNDDPAPKVENRPVAELPALVYALEERLRLTVFCLSHSWGGLEQVAAGDSLDVGGLGLRTRVVCLEGTPIHEHLAGRKEVSLYPLAFRPRNYLDFKMRSEIRKLVLEGMTLVHTHQTSILGSIVPWLWREPQIPVIASRHIMSDHQKKSFVHQAIYGRVDALLVVSETVRRNVLETHAIQSRKVKVVKLGLDFNRFDPARVSPDALRARWGVPEGGIAIGLVGRIDPAKGQGTFIKAAAGLLRGTTADDKLKFVIAGEETRGAENDTLRELHEMVSQFRIEGQVVFAGFQQDIPQVMRALDIVVMPSRQEAFGLVAIEAMAMECPVIISQGGSSEEIVGTGGALMSSADRSGEAAHRCGLIMRPDDAFDLQQKLRYLLNHPEERIAIGKRGRERVLANHDRRLRLRRTLEIYERAQRRRSSL